MSIIILGSAADQHARHVYTTLRGRGKSVNYLNSIDFPKSVRLSYFPTTNEGVLALPDSRVALPLSEIESVYWRSFQGVTTPRGGESYTAELCYYEAMGTLRSWMNSGTQTRWINSWEAFQMHQEKPRQLARVSSLGVAVPRTYVGNDAQALQQFCKSGGPLICKPVYGGSYTEMVTTAHLENGHLDTALQKSPVTIQDYIAGTNIRSYIIGGQIFSAEIKSDQVDFRNDNAASLCPFQLPPDIEKQCIAITHELMLRWTAIDWRRTDNGVYYFLEANPSPMFLQFEELSGYPITQSLVDLLVYPTAS